MKKIILGTIIGFQIAASGGVSVNKKYIEKRDLLVKKIETLLGAVEKKDEEAINKIDSADRDALKELEKDLHALFGPIKVDGFTGPGSINLSTLQDDGGYGQIDGLRFSSSKELLIVTTEFLLLEHSFAKKNNAKDLLVLAKKDGFYSKVFDWGSSFTEFIELPLTKKIAQKEARAFLALNAQDIGPFVPNNIIVLLAKDHRVYMVNRTLNDDEAVQIGLCKAQWEKSQNFEAYRKCFAENIKNQKMFSNLQKIAQSIFDRLQSAGT